MFRKSDAGSYESYIFIAQEHITKKLILMTHKKNLVLASKYIFKMTINTEAQNKNLFYLFVLVSRLLHSFGRQLGTSSHTMSITCGRGTCGWTYVGTCPPRVLYYCLTFFFSFLWSYEQNSS